ncbi:MAG: hypothetical protein ABFE01_09075 [Phycisphaerales bacterium]|jgi:hypothetical protein
MNWEEKIDRLAARARDERSPRVDVAGSVLGILSARKSAPSGVAERLWMWLAAGASAVAVPAAIAAFIIYTNSAQPLSEIAEAIAWAAQ